MTKSLSEYLDELNTYEMNNRSYPVFDTDNFIDFFSQYPYFWLAPMQSKERQRIPLQRICGDNWAFEPVSKRGSYPRYMKLHSILEGYMKKEAVPPVPIMKIMGKYFLQEGNHRLYVSKLIGRKTIVADVDQYDYEFLLKHATLDFRPFSSYLEYEDKLYEISEEQALAFQSLKQSILSLL